MHKDGLIFERKNLDTYHVVPNCYKTQIPKFPLLTWRRASENADCYLKRGNNKHVHKPFWSLNLRVINVFLIVPLFKSKTILHVLGAKSRVGHLLNNFLSESLVFCEQKRDSFIKKSELLPLLFCHAQMRSQ